MVSDMEGARKKANPFREKADQSKMRSLAWDERVLETVASVKTLPLEQFESLGKMAVLVFHNEKQSRRRLTRTASACGWSHEQAERVVLALSKILMDAAKVDLAEPQLQASLKGMAMPDDHADAIVKLYTDHREMIKKNSTRAADLNLPQYRSLEWRVDLEVANRMSRNHPTPIVTLGLNTASQGAEGVPELDTRCFRVDYTTLKKMQTQLETALREVDTVHASRMQRYLH